MFDEEDYYSDEDENVMNSHKAMASSKVLVPSSGSDFNHLTGEGESLLKIMKDRGFDVTDNQIKKIKTHNTSKEKDQLKSKPKTGFFDGGASASLEELMKALNKAFSKADPQQASCILSYILEKKTLSLEDRNKFGIMKCKILFGLGAYQDCAEKAVEFLEKPFNILSASVLSNYIAKSKAELNQTLSGYMDFLRAKSYLNSYKQWLAEEQSKKKQSIVQKIEEKSKEEDFADSEVDTVSREIDHTEMEYNIKMAKFKNSSNLIFPYYPQFRHREVVGVVCGDFHALLLVRGSLNNEQQLGDNKFSTEVFGYGENTVGQITGRASQIIYKQPILISQLSGKNVSGIWAVKESSLAYDLQGNIYEWGIKENRNNQINVTFTVGEEIKHFEKGYQHYALLTQSKKFYTWGLISSKGGVIYKQAKPHMQPAQNIIDFSCGSSSILAIDDRGDVFCLGNNQNGQLGLEGQFLSKSFKKLNNSSIGFVRKVKCINDATFFVNSDEEVYFCGKISYERQSIERPRQGEFGGDLNYIISISGTLGNYYVTNEKGEIYKWDVDSSVKFKLNKQDQKVSQRYVSACRGLTFKVRSMICPELTKVQRVTQEPKSYENIQFTVELRDQLGPYANQNFVLSPKCQIFLSTYPIKKVDLLKENAAFLESFQFSNQENKILLNQIVQSRLNTYKIVKNQEKPWIYDMKITSEESGHFYFYVLMQNQLVYEKQLNIEVSEKEREYSQKNKIEKQMKEEERKRKAELEKQRILEEKLRKQAQEEEKRRDTQKRAEQALKKHMKEQQDQRIKHDEDRRARKELQTGGGFDLSKIKPKNETNKAETIEKSTEMMKSQECFLPDINMRPSSKRKLNLPTKTSSFTGEFESVKTMKNSKGFDEIGIATMSGLGLMKTESQKEKETITKISKASDSLMKTGGLTSSTAKTTATVLKRGLSKGKKP